MKPMVNRKTFGPRLAQFRFERQLTQRQVASRIDQDVACISFWETGTRLPNIVNMLELCQALDISPNELLDWQPSEPG